MIGSSVPRSVPGAERGWLYLLIGVLWASGIAWLVLDLWFARAGEFGREPHPLCAPLLLLHGIVSLPVLYLAGWVSSRHATLQWKLRKRRASGSLFALLLLVLAASGFALFFLTGDAAQRFSAVAHEVIGVLAPLSILEHWFTGRRRGSRETDESA